MRPDPTLEMSWALDFAWERVVPLAKIAPKSEYSRRRG